MLVHGYQKVRSEGEGGMTESGGGGGEREGRGRGERERVVELSWFGVNENVAIYKD